ncbi:MAG TPA: response regulator transcription factor [Gammaproteobacteria bacterium]|jgi:two-component system response regulator PhoP
MRILLLEDEALLRNQLQEQLQQEGYIVDASDNGEEGLYLGNEYPIDAGIIDIGLPGISGLEVIQLLRTNNRNFPILILTARGRWQEKVEGLEAGADDYLTKPFEVQELLARLRAILRRSSGHATSIINNGPIVLDTSTQTVTIEKQLVELTSYEYKILEYMTLHMGKVISKSELTDHIYAQDHDRDSNVIEVFIKRLRNKLDPDQNIQPIETLRGRGYRLKVLQTD